jgi:hypothetical protein
VSQLIADYFRELVDKTGQGWNRFWYWPSDALPLGILRAVTGLFALYWLISFTPDLVRFFGPTGLLPADAVAEFRGTWFGFSYLNLMSSPGELMGVHWAGVLVLLAFTLGIYARISAILALIVVLSYMHRAPMITSQFEPVLAMVMFYLCLGPCGDFCSIDAWLAKRKQPQPLPSKHKTSATVVLRLLQVHLALIYFSMALAKMGGDAWISGEATWWLAARPESRMVDLTGVLQPYPRLVSGWSNLILVFEFLFPVLVWPRLTRPMVLAWSVLHWTGLALLTGNAPWCGLMLAAGIAFVPGEVLRAMVGQSPSASNSATVAEGRRQPVASR